jgi:hypothetical protein
MVPGKRRSASLIVICLLVGLGLAADMMSRPALGQGIGGFLKKKVKDTVKPPESGKDGESASDSNPNSRFNSRVLEMNDENLAKLEKALTCEKEFRDGINAKYAKLPTEQQYQTCSTQAMLSTEAQALVKGGAGDAQAQQQMMTQFAALIEKKCGKSPSTYNKSDELKPGEAQCAKSASLTLDQYSIMKERLTPFCSSGGQEKVHGFGDMYYVYTPIEVTAMKPKCSQLSGQIQGIPVRK